MDKSYADFALCHADTKHTFRFVPNVPQPESSFLWINEVTSRGTKITKLLAHIWIDHVPMPWLFPVQMTKFIQTVVHGGYFTHSGEHLRADNNEEVSAYYRSRAGGFCTEAEYKSAEWSDMIGNERWMRYEDVYRRGPTILFDPKCNIGIEVTPTKQAVQTFQGISEFLNYDDIKIAPQIPLIELYSQQYILDIYKGIKPLTEIAREIRLETKTRI